MQASFINRLRKNVWALPILFAILTLLGLIGALLVEGAVDTLFVALIALALLPIVLQLLSKK